MRKINVLLFAALFFFQSKCFSQSRIIDSLKMELQNAKDDTTRLNIYLKLGEVCEKKDNLLYAEPALNLCDKILSDKLNKTDRDKILEKENRAYNLIVAYYSNNTGTQWNKVLDYMQARLTPPKKQVTKREQLKHCWKYRDCIVTEMILQGFLKTCKKVCSCLLK